MNWKTSGWSIFPIIAIVLIVYLFLHGCATTKPDRTELLIWRDACTGKDHAATVQVHVGLPLIQCPARAAELGLHADAWLYGIAGAFGCAFWSQPVDRISRGEVYLFPGEPFLTHELDHVRGMRHWPHAKEECNG